LKIQTTDLLIAPPQIPDPRFKESVILMINVDPHLGALGLCVNRPTEVILEDLDLGIDLGVSLDFPVYWGGPVNTRTLWMLHSTDWSLPESVELNHQWSMTSTMEMFEGLAQGYVPSYFRLFAGYCSWAPGQLESELLGHPPWNRKHSWLVAGGVDPEWIFEQPEDQLWTSATTLCSHQAVDSWLPS